MHCNIDTVDPRIDEADRLLIGVHGVAVQRVAVQKTFLWLCVPVFFDILGMPFGSCLQQQDALHASPSFCSPAFGSWVRNLKLVDAID